MAERGGEPRGGEEAAPGGEAPREPAGGAASGEAGGRGETRAGQQAEALPLGALDAMVMVRLFLVAFLAKAWQGLGVLPHPTTGRPERDLAEARLAIDAVDALLQAVKGRLRPDEAKGLEGAVAELKLSYVQAAAPPPGGGGAVEG